MVYAFFDDHRYFKIENEKDNFVYFYENDSIFYLNNRHPCSLNMYCICDFCWLLIGEDDEIYGVKVKL